MKYLVLGVAFLIILGIAGYLALSQNDSPEQTQRIPTQAVSNTTPESSEELMPDTSFKEITDTSGTLRIFVPENWEVQKEGAQGVRISAIQATSPDFSMRSDNEAEGPFTPIFYESGATLQVLIQNDTSAESQRPVGVISEENLYRVNEIEGMYFVFKEPSTAQGQLLSYQFVRSGNSVYLRFGYNPESFPEGEKLFRQIINSLSI